jgi:starch synthase (maltosyl-transferring)
MKNELRKRVVIENVRPEIDCGAFPIKRVVGEKVVVEADVFADGHDSVSASLLYKAPIEKDWNEISMTSLENDRWRGEFLVEKIGNYYYSLEGWVDYFKTWQKGFKKKFEAGYDTRVELLIGADLIDNSLSIASKTDRKRLEELSNILKGNNVEEAISFALGDELTNLMDKNPDKASSTRFEKEFRVVVDRPRALFSAWYERFPRSTSSLPGKHGTFKDLEKLLPEIARMGFDVLYLPPIHPIGKIHRKGKNNSSDAKPEDVGSPWAIGSEEGGHKSIHPQIGDMHDFESLVKSTMDLGMEVAMDLAFQCAPDHPYVGEHPEWFRKRPDGTIQNAENPPKKYEDIYPLNFETEDVQGLWEELKSVTIFWINKGVKIFRVDNPHTKAFPFWEWLIGAIKKDYPEVIFLSEAFTRPKVMYRLAKIGFTQSYTYFTWRNTKKEFIDYLTELIHSEVSEFLRPNFWPNTPDILPEHLQFGGRPAFIMRLVLAGTLSSNYGIYGPAFELCEDEALTGKEEYLNSEKYAIREWDWNTEGNLRDLIAIFNAIRKENPALQLTRNLKFYQVDNEYLLFYGKATEDLENIILVVANLDPFHTQSGWVTVPIEDFGIDPDQPYLVHDLLSQDKYIWHGESNYVELNPHVIPAHIFRLRKKLKRETDFDYFL